MIPIKEVDYGIGTNYGDCIEINRHLHEIPELYDKVLQHELSQHDGGFLQDFFHTPEFDPSLWLWMLKHPKSFINFFPYRNRCWDFGLLLFYGIVIVAIMFAWRLI